DRSSHSTTSAAPQPTRVPPPTIYTTTTSTWPQIDHLTVLHLQLHSLLVYPLLQYTRPPHLLGRPTQETAIVTVNDNQGNDITPDNNRTTKLKHDGKSLNSAQAKLNMGGIIALGVFGGFTLLAITVTLIFIFVRRLINIILLHSDSGQLSLVFQLAQFRSTHNSTLATRFLSLHYLFNGPYAMGGYEVTADSEQPMMFRVCLSAVKTDQWLPPKKSHVGVFDVTCIRFFGSHCGSRLVSAQQKLMKNGCDFSIMSTCSSLDTCCALFQASPG
ncbi:unnamed protein product, partial [Larinioides sclopetarius]